MSDAPFVARALLRAASALLPTHVGTVGQLVETSLDAARLSVRHSLIECIPLTEQY